MKKILQLVNVLVLGVVGVFCVQEVTYRLLVHKTNTTGINVHEINAGRVYIAKPSIEKMNVVPEAEVVAIEQQVQADIVEFNTTKTLADIAIQQEVFLDVEQQVVEYQRTEVTTVATTETQMPTVATETPVPTGTSTIIASSATLTPTLYPGLRDIRQPDGSAKEFVQATIDPDCPSATLEMINLEWLYDTMLEKDGKMCFYKSKPYCPSNLNQYIDWDLIKMIAPRLPDDESYYDVIARTADVKEVAQVRGIYFNIPDDGMLNVDESLIWDLLFEAVFDDGVCSDTNGRPVITRVAPFINAIEQSVVE